MNESYEVYVKYFNPNTGYWESDKVIVFGYKNKKSHKKAGLDVARDFTQNKKMKSVEVISVSYV